MLKLYYTKKDESLSKIREWLFRQEVDFVELPSELMTLDELKQILSLCEDGFDNIIAYHSKSYQALARATGNLIDLHLDEFMALLLEYHKCFKNGILVNLEKEQLTVGYNAEDIRCFIPRNRRRMAQIMRGADTYGYRGLQPSPVTPARQRSKRNVRKNKNNKIGA